LSTVYQQFLSELRDTTVLEFIAVLTGIASVWFSRIENIWVYPVGMISTTIYIYISIKGHLLGEASVNLYYTIMSIYGWIVWTRKDAQKDHLVRITWSDRSYWIKALIFFGVTWGVLYVALSYAKAYFAPGAIPLADGFSAAAAYTGMWLMARKKIENWIWWIVTDLASIPLYFVKGYAFTSFQFLVFTVMAVFGLVEWNRRWKEERANLSVC